jgi:hypothetical protein
VNCHACGAALTPADYTMPSCRYCGAAHAHHARAAEKVLVVQQLMGGFLPPAAPPIGAPGFQGSAPPAFGHAVGQPRMQYPAPVVSVRRDKTLLIVFVVAMVALPVVLTVAGVVVAIVLR